MSYKELLDSDRIPHHIAIIMDGNGRWAKAKGMQRSAGHQEGVETVKKITEEAARLGVKHLTLYTFSTENWNRPEDEVATLMGLVIDALEDQIFMKNNIRFRAIGERKRLSETVRKRIEECEKRTEKNDRMTMVVALSYSSRWELTETCKEIATEVLEGKIKPNDISESTIDKHLETSFMPNPDLLIRTGGEIRLSNYLLWQCAYSELYFCDTFWPDFNEEELCKAIFDYQKRERRYGKTSEQIAENN